MDLGDFGTLEKQCGYERPVKLSSGIHIVICRIALAVQKVYDASGAVELWDVVQEAMQMSRR